MATPHISGAMALLWSAHPELQNQIDASRDALNNSAVHIASTQCGAAGPPNNVYGWGRVDILAASSVPIEVTSVVSRKAHGGAGTFDLNLPRTGNPGIEGRSGGAGNDHQIVFTFASAVTFNSASVTTGTGTVGGTSGNGTTTVSVNLTGVTNAQTITVTLAGVSNGASTADVAVSMGLLQGDTNGDGTVNSGDAIQTRGRSGQSADATNYRSDVNIDGIINSGDAIAVRSRSGSSLTGAETPDQK